MLSRDTLVASLRKIAGEFGVALDHLEAVQLPDGTMTCECTHRHKKLVFLVHFEGVIEYVKNWGPEASFQSSNGEVGGDEDLREHLRWLFSDPTPF